MIALLLIGGLPSTAAADDLLDEVTTSDDFRQPHADILRLYFAIFDRAPDLGGARFWIDQYDQGMHIEVIADHMTNSPEFLERYGSTTTEDFVEALYSNVLGRDPDPEGFAFWNLGLGRQAFTRLWVIRHFADSSEFVADHQFAGEESAEPGPPITRPVGTAGPVITFSVEVEPVLGWAVEDAQLEIVNILGDPRSWVAGGTQRFQLVVEGEADVRIRIATPSTVDARCLPLRTGGTLSCRNGRSLNLNSDRWAGATSFWTEPLAEYRAYLINHEMGHYLGFGHQSCPVAGAFAPVMQQQTKSLQGCAPNGWPYPS